ncbi:MAG: gamma-glutamyl-gamma-aminobutyrate hydrolase family protein [Thermodesulfobacteriota bacterium]
MRRFFLLFMVVVVFVGVAVQGSLGSGGTRVPVPVVSEYQNFAAGGSNVWVVVNLFHGQTSKQAVKVRDILAGLGAGGKGMVLPFSEVTVEHMERIRPAFLALSPNGVPWCKYRGKSGEALGRFLEALRVIVEEMNIPVVGICGGHQALALAFGGKVGPILGREDDCLPYGKNPTERGRHEVFVRAEDPIFLGAGKSLNLVQNHYDEVKRLPSGFVWLAENRLSPYQIMRHPTKPAYGIQAHTEYYLPRRPDGATLLRNFLRIAAAHNSKMRAASAPTPVTRSTATQKLPSEPGTHPVR